MTEKIRSSREEAIAQLSAEQRARWRELAYRGDTLNDAYTDLSDAYSRALPDSDPSDPNLSDDDVFVLEGRRERQHRVLALLAAERDAAWEEADLYCRELGIAED